MLPPAGATVTETEPNNNFLQANAVPPGEWAAGDCTADEDVVSVAFNASRKVDVEYFIETGSVLLEIRAPSGDTVRGRYVSGTGAWGFVTVSAGDYKFRVACRQDGHAWQLRATDAGGPQGLYFFPGEVEYNDNQVGATTFNASSAFQGRLEATYDPVDMWRVLADSPWAARVTLTTSDPTAVQLAPLDSVGHPQGPVGGALQLSDSANDRFWFAVVAIAGERSYTLSVVLYKSVAEFHEGASEDEPNQDRANATAIVVNGTVSVEGRADSSEDAADFFSIAVPEPLIVTATYSPGWSCTSPCDRFSVELADGSPVRDEFGDPVGGSEVEFLVTPERRVLLRIEAGSPGGPYTVALTARHAALAAGRQVDALTANQTRNAIILASGASSGAGRGDLGPSGEGKIYGRCMLLGILNEEPVALSIRVPAGQRWRPDDPSVGPYVTTRDQVFEVPAWTYSEFPMYAAAEGPTGFFPSTGVGFFLDAPATGKLKQVTEATAAGNQSAASEIIAIWSAVGGVSRADIETYSPSPASVEEAGRVLVRAGLQSDLNPPPVQGGPFGVVLLALVAAGVVGLVVVRRRSAGKAPASPPAPLAGTPVPGAAPTSPAARPAPAPYTYAPMPPPPTPGGKSFFQRAPGPEPEIVYVDAPPEETCPQCGSARKPWATYCLSCGEFFVK